MEIQNLRDAVASQIAELPDNQIEAVWNYLKELTDAENNQEELLNQYLTFWCDRQLLGVRIEQVIQIFPIAEITPLPDFPAYMKGVISLREEMVPVMDLQLKLGRAETPCTSHTCIIIIKIRGCSLGLIVDAVNEVEYISEDEICPPPGQIYSDMNYLEGIAKREDIILILSTDHLLSEKEINTVLNLPDDIGQIG